MNYKQIAQSIRQERRLLWEEAGRPVFKYTVTDPRQQSLYMMMTFGNYPWKEFNQSDTWHEVPWT